MQEARIKPVKVMVDPRHRITIPKEFRGRIGKLEEVQCGLLEDEIRKDWQIVIESVGKEGKLRKT